MRAIPGEGAQSPAPARPLPHLVPDTGTPDAQTVLRLELLGANAPESLPFVLGALRRWYVNAGVRLVLADPRHGLESLEDLAAGTADVVVTTPWNLAAAASRGQAVVGFARFLHGNSGVAYLKNRGLDRPRDLAHARLHCPVGQEGLSTALVRSLVEADGGSAHATSLTWVHGAMPETELLVQQHADALAPAQYARHVMGLRHQHQDVGFWSCKEWRVPDLDQLVLATSPAYLARHQPTLERLVVQLRRGVDMIYQFPESARSLWLQRQDQPRNVDRTVCAAILPCFTYDLGLSREYLDHLQQWMVRYGLLENPADAGAFWTNRLAV